LEVKKLDWTRALNTNWQSGEVKMSHCPNHCHTCENEANVERKALLTEEVNIRACCTSPMPEPDVEMEDIPNLANVDDSVAAALAGASQ
jgi:hypothetical protein